MSFKITYHELVVKEDISKLSKTDKERTKKAIESKLAVLPEIFGGNLRNSLKGYKKLRVGDFRVVFRIEEKIVKIFCIENRSVVYKIVGKRI